MQQTFTSLYKYIVVMLFMPFVVHQSLTGTPLWWCRVCSWVWPMAFCRFDVQQNASCVLVYWCHYHHEHWSQSCVEKSWRSETIQSKLIHFAFHDWIECRRSPITKFSLRLVEFWEPLHVGDGEEGVQAQPHLHGSVHTHHGGHGHYHR
mgnify:CR=1 FL=1